MQVLWKLNIGWDQSVTLDMHSSWIRFKNQISNLSKISINRLVIYDNPLHVQLHCFTDASEVAYGAVFWDLQIRAIHLFSYCAPSLGWHL